MLAARPERRTFPTNDESESESESEGKKEKNSDLIV